MDSIKPGPANSENPISTSPEPSSIDPNQASREARERYAREQRKQFEAARRLAKAQALFQSSGIRPRFAEADLNVLGEVPERFAPAAAHLRAMLETPYLSALIGKRGTGKTWLASGLVREFCRQCRSARYTTAMDLFREIRNEFNKDGGNEARIVDRLAKLDLLVIDEIQVRSESTWENNILTDVLDQRYNTLRPTLLISNLDVPGFQACVGDSIASRICGSGNIIVAKWESFRQPGAERLWKPEFWANGRPKFPPCMEGCRPTDGTWSDD